MEKALLWVTPVAALDLVVGYELLDMVVEDVLMIGLAPLGVAKVETGVEWC